MRVWTTAILVGGLIAGCGRAACGQAPAAAAGKDIGKTPPGSIATVTYRYERPGMAVPRFRLVAREDGTASYDGEEVAAAAGRLGAAAEPVAPRHVEQQISISTASTAKIFKAARAEKYFHVACASRAKNIADTGAKTLSYEGADGKGSCSYNYTEDKNVAMLTDLFLGIALTLEEGRKLEFKSRYDHLGLDAELDVLTQENEAGRAVELGTIAPVLRRLASDSELMERVRLRSTRLLDRAAEGK